MANTFSTYVPLIYEPKKTGSVHIAQHRHVGATVVAVEKQ